MDELKALRSLAREMGVYTQFTDGLERRVSVAPETLVRVCAALGAPVSRFADAAEALRARRTAPVQVLAPVLVAWDGILPPVTIPGHGGKRAEIQLEDGGIAALEAVDGELRSGFPLPPGYHRLTLEVPGEVVTSTVIAAPLKAWRRSGIEQGWGVAAQMAALRSARSRSVADLRDLEALARWISERGGDLVMLLPPLPTFNSDPPEPSPYSAVSRLFWSELILDLGDAHAPTSPPAILDVTRADAEVRAALADHPAAEPSAVDAELARYARFRGAQLRLGRSWREWPAGARDGDLEPHHIDPDEERFHLVAQTLARRQLTDLAGRLEADGTRLGLDLAVGVHADGYDPWSRPSLFTEGMSVGAPPDEGFPSGQDWGFAPLLPEASRREAHRYVAASIAHQASVAGVLRVDHVMAWTRLYWIPHGLGLDEGTYVAYPHEELFAVLTLESHRNRCEIVGENLGTVPPEIDEALRRHRIRGMYLTQFEAAKDSDVVPPDAEEVALVGTHDTPTFAGWLAGLDIEERVRHALLAEEEVDRVRKERARAVERLAGRLGCTPTDPREFLAKLLEWLGRSESPLVIPWLEDLWLEETAVNLPGTRSSERPNWQRPMRRLLDEVFVDPGVDAILRRLQRARNRP